MGLIDNIRKSVVTKAPSIANSAIFSFVMGNSPPEMKAGEFVGAYRGWVYACVSAIAEDIAAIDLYMEEKRGNDWVRKDSPHIALDTLNDVNPFTTSSELLIATQSFLELEGNAFWYLPKGGRTQKPAEIWLLDPTRTSIAKDAQNYIGGYTFKLDATKEIPFEVSEIVHFKRFNPFNRYRGMGTVQAAAMAIDIDTYTAQYNKNFFYNSAIPSGTLETEQVLSAEQFERLKVSWDQQYKGVDNAHRVALLQAGMKFNPMTLSQRDMEFLEQRRYSRDEIMGIFRVPKTVLGISEDVNRANAEATDYVFSKRVVKPRMQFIIDSLNEFYLPLFGEDQRRLRFAFGDPVPENVELKLREDEVGVNAGFMTRNEVREKRGLPPVQGGDDLLVPLNLVPLGSAAPAPSDEETPTKTIKIVGTKKTTKEADEKELVAKRIRFITNQITENRTIYKEHLLQMKADIIRALKKKKMFNSKVKGTELDEIMNLIFDDAGRWEKTLVTTNEKLLSDTVLYAGKQAIRKVGMDVAFDLLNPRAVAWIRENGLQHARSVVGSIRDEVRARVVAGVTEGLGAKDIANNIGTFFDDQADFRALRIARTEVISGYGEGTLEGYRQSGVVRMKRWLTAGDAKVEPECLANENQGAIPLETNFAFGGGSPPVHPNCRCVLQPEIGE